MSDNKKYYYLKFFETEEMIILQSMPDGYLYSDILMKLYLRSLKNGGRLMFKGIIPYTSTILAQVVRHQVGVVKKALQIFQQLNLIEVLDNGAIYMCDIQNFIGESSSEADRKRAYRQRIKSEQNQTGHLSGQMSDIRPPEIEIDIELDKEIEKEIYSPAEPDNAPQKPIEKNLSKPTQKTTNTKFKDQVNDIINYLNAKLNTKYKTDNKKTLELIKARISEGFTVEDFKTVIDKKAFEWADDANMCQYLRPVTLFATKFESYLNQPFTKHMSETDQSIMALLNDDENEVWF